MRISAKALESISDAIDSFLNPRFGSKKAASIKQEQQAEESIEVESYSTRYGSVTSTRYGSVTLHSIYSRDGVPEIHPTTTSTNSSDSSDSAFSLLESGDLHGTFSLLETSCLQYNNIGQNIRRYQNEIINLFEEVQVILDVCRHRKRMMELGHYPQVLFPDGEPVFRPAAIAYEIDPPDEDTSNHNACRSAPLCASVMCVINDRTSESEEINEGPSLIDETIPEFNDAEDDDQSIPAIATLVDETANENTTSNENDTSTNEDYTNEAPPVVVVLPERPTPTTWHDLLRKKYADREQQRRSRGMHRLGCY